MHLRARGLALVATVGLLAAACGGDSDAGAEATTEPTTDGAAAEGELLVWADETRVDAIQQIGDQFTEDTGVTVRVVEKAGDIIRADFETQAPAGQGPDVIVGAHDWIGNFIANGLIVPVELGDKAAEFEQVAIDAFTFEGQTYGLPYAIENIALLRNTDLAPDKPASWDDMIATGQALVDSGAAKLPFAVQMNGEAGDPYHFYPLQTSFGSFVFGQTEDGTWNPDDVQLDNEGGLEFAQFLNDNGEAGTGIFSTSITGDIAITEFNEGRLPYWITGPWNVGGAQDAGINLVVEEIPSPGGDVAAPFVGVQGFMISNFSQNQLLANEFVVNYLGTEELALQLYEIGDRAPAMISALEQVSSDPVIAGFAEVGAAGSPLPNIPEMAAVWTEWGNAEGAIVLGRGDPVELWTTMADKVRENIAGPPPPPPRGGGPARDERPGPLLVCCSHASQRLRHNCPKYLSTGWSSAIVRLRPRPHVGRRCMSETGTTAPPSPPATTPPGSRRRRGQPWFGGSTGTALLAKIVGLALVNALAIFGALTLWSFESWGMLAALVVLTVVINWAYLSSRTIAAKYLVPGLIFLMVYQVFIVVYTLGLSFTNFGDGNQGTKEAAIETLLARNEKRVEGSPALPVTIIERGDELGFLVADPETGEPAVGTAETPLEPAGDVQYTELSFAQIIERQDEVFNLRVPISEDPEDGSLRTTDGRTAFLFRSILVYDEATDTLTNVETGETFVADSDVGRFRSTETERTITPGWQQFIGLENYTRLLTDPRIREPFFSVFVWNFVFAFFSVALPFALGLSAAMALQHKTMRGVRLYRSVLILPYAIPAFLTTLVWQGMLNTRFGFVNQVLLDGATIPWLTDPFLARFSVLFVQLWLGFPYFLIISTGALTAIPEDILEAAKVDGATANQTFWRVKWPLLLTATAPLMIASFAFNFNNYNVIRFLTNGGPLDTTAAVTYGATDILITFVDKLAFQGVARQYGFASAISIVIFVLIAAISYIGFKRTQTFEEID